MPPKIKIKVWLCFLAIWLCYALLLATHKVALGIEQGLEISFGRALLRPGVEAFWWALGTPIILRLARLGWLSPFSWQRLVYILLGHIFFGVLITYLHNQASTFSLFLIQGSTGFFNPFSYRWLAHFMRNPLPMTYFLIIAICQIYLYGIGQQRERAAFSRLEAAHSRLKLANLKQNLHPHLLFNTLHAIQVRSQAADPKMAATMIDQLANYLRLVLDQRAKDLIPLEQELKNLDAFLAIDAFRFADRDQLDIEVTPGLGEVLIPAFCLQTLFENAVKHGDRSKPMTMRIDAEDNEIVILMANHFSAAEAHPPGWGIGLTVLRQQLDFHFPKSNQIEFRSTGQQATITLRFSRRCEVLA